MKKILCFVLSFILCIGLSVSPVSADDYVTFSINIVDNGNGTVTVMAYAPAGVYSGKIVVDTTDDLVYTSATVPGSCMLNEEYNKNGVTGICIVFAYAAELTQETLIYTGEYTVSEGATIDTSDVFSYEWNLTNGDKYVGSQKDGGVDVNYTEKTYVVRFYDFNNQLLKEETVVSGGAATAPSAPSVEGYTFNGWDKAFENVQGDLAVYAQYKINTYTVSFVAGEGGNVSGNTTIAADHGTAVSSLPFPEAVADDGYVFSKWEYTYDVVTSDVTITAIFVEAPSYLLGDVNNDGLVDNLDAAVILKYDSALIDENEYILNAGDVNNDGYVDNMDAAKILKYDAGVIDSL